MKISPQLTHLPEINANLFATQAHKPPQTHHSQKPVLQPQRQSSRAALALFGPWHKDLSTAVRKHLLDDCIRDVLRRVDADTVFLELGFVAFDDAGLVPGGVHCG